MNLYAWNFWEYVVYTITENPQPGDYIYKDTGVAYEYEEYHYNFINDWYYSNIIETVQTGATPKIGIRANKDRPEEQVVEFERNPSGDLEVEGGEEPENLVSKFVHNSVTYTIKDAQAREDIANKQDKLSSTNVLTTGSGNVIDGISASDGIITATKNTTLSTVATSGSYSDLSNKPTIPTVNDASVTINQGGTLKGSFTLNQSGNTTINLDSGASENVDSIKNQNSLRTTPVKVWTGSEAQFKQDTFANWVSSTSPVTLGETFSNCYGVGKFLIIPGYYTDNNNYLYSTDGKNWTASTLPLDASLTRVKARWLHDRFISFCTNGQYEYSFDGINWSTGTFPITDTPPWDIAYGNNNFVVVFQNATNTSLSMNKAAYSEDGINWTVSTITNTQGSGNVYWRSIVFFKDKFIAFRLNSSMFAYSSDGISWTTGIVSNYSYGNWYWFAHSDDICVGCCNGRSGMIYSTNGTSWTFKTLPDGYRHNVIYDGVRFIMMPAERSSYEPGGSGFTNTVLISTDGLNWSTSNITVPVAGDYLSVTYGDNKVVAVQNNTTNIITQEYTPLSTTHSDYLCFVEDNKIQLGDDVFVKQSESEDNTVELSGSAVTITKIKAGTHYVLNDSALTAITFTSCEQSYKETTIEFSTGSTIPTLTDNSGITWVDGSAPTLSANKSYLILITNKLGFVKEY